ncbi:MAG: hypothetical protein ACLUNO_08100 [Oscillospiraceae bacterium]
MLACGWQFGGWRAPCIELAFIWIVTVDRVLPGLRQHHHPEHQRRHQDDLLALTVGVLGIVYVVKNGFVNDMAASARFCRGLTCTVCRISRSSSSTSSASRWCAPMLAAWRDPGARSPRPSSPAASSSRLIYLFSAFGIGAAVPTHGTSAWTPASSTPYP